MLDTVKKNLEEKGYRVSVFESSDAAVSYLAKEIDGVSVGFGGSMTVKELGLCEKLSENNEVYYHGACPPGMTPKEVIAKAAAAEVYVSSVNALAETGEIVNIDGNCNRVASIMHGHARVYLVVGVNKIAVTVDAAIDRARNVSAPKNAKRLGKNTPCVTAGRCMNCSSPERICRALSLLYCAPSATKIEVVLIQEELGD